MQGFRILDKNIGVNKDDTNRIKIVIDLSNTKQQANKTTKDSFKEILSDKLSNKE